MRVAFVILAFCVLSASAFKADKEDSALQVKSVFQCDEFGDLLQDYRDEITNCTTALSPNTAAIESCESDVQDDIDVLIRTAIARGCISTSPSESPASSFPPEEGCTCLEYNSVSSNVLTFEDCQLYSDTEGTLYCGGDAKLSGHSIGDKLGSNFAAEAVVVVKQNLLWTNGRLYTGKVYAGSADIHSSVQIDPADVIIDPNFYDFDGARTYYEGMSTALCNKPATGTIHLSTGREQVKAGQNALDIYYLNCSDLRASSSLEFLALSDSATAVLNIMGAQCSFRMGDVIVPRASRMIFNFCETVDLHLSNTPVVGSILAPFAAITGNGGVVAGQVIARSFKGQTQQNLVICDGCVSNKLNGRL